MLCSFNLKSAEKSAIFIHVDPGGYTTNYCDSAKMSSQVAEGINNPLRVLQPL